MLKHTIKTSFKNVRNNKERRISHQKINSKHKTFSCGSVQ